MAKSLSTKILARSCTIRDARQALPYTMPCPQCQTVYHAMPRIASSHVIYHAMPRQTIPYTMLCPLGYTICHAMPTRPYHIPCHARQAIPYTMPCIARPYNILYHAIPFPMPCPPGHTMPCPSGHTTYHNIKRGMPSRRYMYLTMPARSYHIPCHATTNDFFGKSSHLSKGANGLVARCTIACNACK